MFAQTSAATTAASRTTALPVSVSRNARSGVWRFRVHAVRPLNGAVETSVSAMARSFARGRLAAGGGACLAAVVARCVVVFVLLEALRAFVVPARCPASLAGRLRPGLPAAGAASRARAARWSGRRPT